MSSWSNDDTLGVACIRKFDSTAPTPTTMPAGEAGSDVMKSTARFTVGLEHHKYHKDSTPSYFYCYKSES